MSELICAGCNAANIRGSIPDELPKPGNVLVHTANNWRTLPTGQHLCPECYQIYWDTGNVPTPCECCLGTGRSRS